MELREPKIEQLLVMAAYRHRVLPARIVRYRKCYNDFLIYLKNKAGDWVDPRSIRREDAEAYLNDLVSRGCDFSIQLLGFEVLDFLFNRVRSTR